MNKFTIAIAKERNYVPADLEIKWEKLSVIFDELLTRKIESTQDLERWLKDRSELEAILQEDYAWRYIRMTCDTESAQYQEDFQYFAIEIEPKISPVSNELDKKLVESPFAASLDVEKYRIYLRKVKNAIVLFRPENVSIFTKIQLEQQKFQAIAAAMTITVDHKEITLQQAAVYFKSQDRKQREQIWRKVGARRLQNRAELDDLFDELKDLRQQVAVNANFDNFRDYMFQAMGRFDYAVADCENFHDAIADHVVPLLKQQGEKRKEALGVDILRPWDMDVDVSGRPALKPFTDGIELIKKTQECFNRIDPQIGECLIIMEQHGLFDVESRKGKAPGGYNYPLAASGMPFIFMNAAGNFRDLTTMIHEGGHALHTFLTADLELNDFKEAPSEVAELASMSMELISMDYWDVFFDKKEDLKRAKREQLNDVLKTLPWVATIDCFQHWIYTYPDHTAQERAQAWKEIFERFGGGFCNWTDLEIEMQYQWQKQIHLYEVPFYYIEYGMAQLGAIAVWKNIKENPETGLEAYLSALKLGYTKSIPEIYDEAGIKFDFSAAYVCELIQFIQSELEKT